MHFLLQVQFPPTKKRIHLWAIQDDENNLKFCRAAIENRMFAPPVEFLRLLMAQNST